MSEIIKIQSTNTWMAREYLGLNPSTPMPKKLVKGRNKKKPFYTVKSENHTCYNGWYLYCINSDFKNWMYQVINIYFAYYLNYYILFTGFNFLYLFPSFIYLILNIASEYVC